MKAQQRGFEPFNFFRVELAAMLMWLAYGFYMSKSRHVFKWFFFAISQRFLLGYDVK